MLQETYLYDKRGLSICYKTPALCMISKGCEICVCTCVCTYVHVCVHVCVSAAFTHLFASSWLASVATTNPCQSSTPYTLKHSGMEDHALQLLNWTIWECFFKHRPSYFLGCGNPPADISLNWPLELLKGAARKSESILFRVG